jgi:FtsP/CotA-like multicopper oxidase with cupredoxin domain
MRNYDQIRKMRRRWSPVAMVTIMILLMGATSYAMTWDYYLKAGVTEIAAGTYNAASPQLPNENVLMWGYALCGVGALGACGPVTFPGPVLLANEGDTLNIHLLNALTPPAVSATTPTAYPGMIQEPTSLIINGQPTTYTPVWVSVNPDGVPQAITSNGSRAAGDVTSRVRSFTTETNVGTTGLYTWGPLVPGTFLYESGTHPAVQVQMGLYGALKVYPAVNPATLVAGVPTPPPSGAATTVRAYSDASTAYNFDVTLVYSEIDQELHYSIASGLYGTPPPAPPGAPTRGQMTSTYDYVPTFFLINGTPYTSALPPILNAAMVAKKTLFRFLNAGLKEKTPTLLNLYMSIIAEDGSPYTYTATNGTSSYYSKQQYSLLLPAGSTRDALMTPAATGNLPVFDRSQNLTNASVSPGGMLTYLQVVPTAAAVHRAQNRTHLHH